MAARHRGGGGHLNGDETSVPNPAGATRAGSTPTNPAVVSPAESSASASPSGLHRRWSPCGATVQIAPSLLAANFGELAVAAAAAEVGGADRLHVDVMDGVFVPNFTFGTDTVRMLRKATTLPLELHLMIVEPDRHLETFARAGADAITVHYEAAPHLHRALTRIRQLDCRAGAALNPSTPALVLDDILEICDLALVMTIDPGFGGQKLIPRMFRKVEQLRREIDRQGLQTELEVDGGVDAGNAADCVAAGANVLVAGTAVFGHPDGIEAGISAMRQSAES